MSLENIFDISGSALRAQSIRLNTVSSNIANAESVSSSIDETYRARYPIFSAIQSDLISQQEDLGFEDDENIKGVAVVGIVESDRSFNLRYEPDHPMANDQGYVAYPNVNVVEEMSNMISASRSFQTNVDVMSSAKDMVQRLLTLGK